MSPDTVTLSSETAEALSDLGMGDFCEVEQPERMAWVVLVLKALDDTPERFPKGKWATIQALECQVYYCAGHRAGSIMLGGGAK